jgi:hypothetical protein
VHGRQAALLAQLLELASRYAGRPALASERIYADLNINGSDFIEFVEEVETHYGVDLGWVSPRQRGVKAQDPTIEALANDVLLQRG